MSRRSILNICATLKYTDPPTLIFGIHTPPPKLNRLVAPYVNRGFWLTATEVRNARQEAMAMVLEYKESAHAEAVKKYLAQIGPEG